VRSVVNLFFATDEEVEGQCYISLPSSPRPWPSFLSLRSDPCFQGLPRRMNFPLPLRIDLPVAAT
jgi:hypothetical protein